MGRNRCQLKRIIPWCGENKVYRYQGHLFANKTAYDMYKKLMKYRNMRIAIPARERCFEWSLRAPDRCQI